MAVQLPQEGLDQFKDAVIELGSLALILLLLVHSDVCVAGFLRLAEILLNAGNRVLVHFLHRDCLIAVRAEYLLIFKIDWKDQSGFCTVISLLVPLSRRQRSLHHVFAVDFRLEQSGTVLNIGKIRVKR